MTTENSTGRDDPSFSKSLFNVLLRTMTDVSGSPWKTIGNQESDVLPDEVDPVRIMLTLNGSLRGECLLEFRRAEASLLASKILRSKLTEFGGEQSKALLKLVTSGSNAFCAELEQEYGNFTIIAAPATDQLPDRANALQRTASSDDGDRVPIWIYPDASLIEKLSSHAKSRGAAPFGAAMSGAEGTIGAAVPVNLDLVLDVELNVTLRFGKRQLTLREVLELTSGSVVELDRQVEEPVELLLDGVLIARGEAVVVDGNYGLRVTEVSQPFPQVVLR